MALIAWSGAIKGQAHRVIDMGANAVERLIVEVQSQPDAMGGRGWQRLDPIPRDIFEAMLLQSGVVK